MNQYGSNVPEIGFNFRGVTEWYQSLCARSVLKTWLDVGVRLCGGLHIDVRIALFLSSFGDTAMFYDFMP